LTVGASTEKHRRPRDGDKAPPAIRGEGCGVHARSATIHADPQRIDNGICVVRDELLPAVMDLDGCIGLSMLSDRASGRCIVTTTWASAPAMRATRETAHDLVQRAAKSFESGDITVDEWEIAVMHRAFMAGDASCARVTWLRCDPAVLPQALEDLPLTLLPRIDDTKGFCGLDLFVDRTTGNCLMTGFYEDRHTLEVSRDQTEPLRKAMAEHMGMTITEGAELDLPIQHLRVPQQL
jgi:quinol monooxygenase YgiN